MSPAQAPETVTDAVTLLAADGFDTNFTLEEAIARCDACNGRHDPAQLVVRRTFRFEGNTDPADESIVLGVECPTCHVRGVIVSAYGPEAEPQLLALLERLEP